MPTPENHPDAIAIITIDRIPAWMLPAFGCGWVAMPNLDAFAGRAIILDRVMALHDDAAATLTAIAGGMPMTSAGSLAPVIAAAYDKGWRTAVITDDTVLAGFADAPVDVCHVPCVSTDSPAVAEGDTNLAKLFGAASDMVVTGKHRLVWCHATSLGITWDAPNHLRDRYVDLDDPPPPCGVDVPTMRVNDGTDPDVLVSIRHVFAGQLTLLDHAIGMLLEAIARRAEQWTILVMGVRGIGLGLHGIVGGAPMPPWSELMQLPTIFVDHAGRMAGQRFGGLVIPADLGATLLDLLGHKDAPSTDPRIGRTLVPLLNTWQGPGRDRVVSHTVHGTAMTTPSWHLVLPDRNSPAQTPSRLFSKPDDFFELCDVADRCPAVAEELSTLARSAPDQAWTTPLSQDATGGS